MQTKTFAKIRQVQLQCERVYHSERNDEQRGRKTSIAHKKDCDDKTCRSQDVAVQSVRLNEVFQGEDRELETQTELNTANDGLRHYPSEQFYEPCQREHQHDNANSQACAEKDVPTQFLADNQ